MTIPGAAQGKGLGHQFLRHTERTRLLLHMLDLDPQSGRDPVDDLRVIDDELAGYSAELARRPQLIVANKADLPDAVENRARVERFCAENALALRVISAATGAGLTELVRAHFKLTPKGIIEDLDLRRPIYKKTAAFGHFGRSEPEFTWEMTDKAASMKKQAGL